MQGFRLGGLEFEVSGFRVLKGSTEPVGPSSALLILPFVFWDFCIKDRIVGQKCTLRFKGILGNFAEIQDLNLELSVGGF